ncbi:MAG: hypothetical protein NVSMB10_19350 [Steroidobacteraceae bacterium]
MVMLTELRRNAGLSVTTCFAELATDIVAGLFDIGLVIQPGSIIWIEHFEGELPPAAPWYGETWDQVSMVWTGRAFRDPSWVPYAGDRFRCPALGPAVNPHHILLPSG